MLRVEERLGRSGCAGRREGPEEKLRPNRIFARAVGNNANKVKLYVYSKVNDKIIFSTTNLGNHFIAV